MKRREFLKTTAATAATATVLGAGSSFNPVMAQGPTYESVKAGGWASFYSTLVDSLGQGLKGGPNDVFQYAAAPMDASWATNTAYNTYNMLDIEPMELGGFYLRSTQNISSAYGDFLNNLRIGTSPDNKDYVKASMNLTAALSVLSNAQTDAANAFKSWKTNNPGWETDYPDVKTTNSWLKTEGDAYEGAIVKARVAVKSYQDEIGRWQTQQAKPLQAALAKYNDPANQQSVVLPDSGGNQMVYTGTITPSLVTDLPSWRAGGGNNYGPVTIDSNTSVGNAWKVSGSGTIGYDNGFIGGYVKGQMTVSNDVWDDKAFSVKISVQALKLYTLARGGWWTGSLLSEYSKGPFYDSRLTPASFFGPKGTLKLIPSMVLVGYAPTCVMTTSNSTYSRYEKDWRGEAGVRIGPFHFSSSVSKSTVDTTSSKTNTSITFGPKDPAAANPQIIGVLSQRFA